MPKETKIKFGQKATIKIKRGKKAVAAKKPVDDRRYGPPPFGEDPPREPPPPIITLHDASQVFRQKKYRERLSSIALTGAAYQGNANPFAGDIFKWCEMFYEPLRAGFLDSQSTWHNVISQTILRGPTNNPANSGDPPTSDIVIFDEVDVFRLDSGGDEVNYRKNDFCWPVGKTVTIPGLTLRIGIKEAVIGGTGWVDKPQKAENKIAEVDSLAMPIAVGTNAWSRGARDYYSKPGAFRPRIKSGTYPVRVQCSTHFYEPFDSADTTNYKVTAEPLYSAPEVSGRFFIGREQFRVYMVPQLWKSDYDTPDYTVHDFARTLPPQKWFRYRSPNFQPVFDHDSLNRHRYASDTTGESPFTLNSGEYLYEDKLEFLSLPIAATNFPHLESSPDQVALLAYLQFGISMFRIWEQQGFTSTPEDSWPISGNVVVTNTQTPAERLVGAIKVSDEKKYYIWRKTETERDLATLYSGKVSPISNANAAAIVDYFNELTVPPQDEQWFRLLDFA